MDTAKNDEREERRRRDELTDELVARASAADIPFKRERAPSGNPVLTIDLGPEDDPGCSVRIFSVQGAEALLSTEFENYRIVPGYEAIHSTAEELIEVRIRPVGLLAAARRRKPFDGDWVMVGPDEPARKIEFTSASDVFQAIFPRPFAGSARPTPPQGPPVLVFRGFHSKTKRAAERTLTRLGPTIEFETDLVYDMPIEMVRSQDLHRRGPRAWKVSDEPPSFPSNEYEAEAVTLYMYGRSARGMPLLEYLAYYQSIEFFFPRYSAAEIRHRVEKIVKDPRFNPHLDQEIGRLMDVVHGQRGKVLSRELDQLKVTIRSCMEQDEIRDFIEASEERTAFFRDRKSSLTKRTVSLLDTTIDLRDAVAARIYDLRCRIVHTKDQPEEEELKRLLPNSPEAQRLSHDIALARLVAARVIVASSRELVLDRRDIGRPII